MGRMAQISLTTRKARIIKLIEDSIELKFNKKVIATFQEELNYIEELLFEEKEERKKHKEIKGEAI